MGVLIPPADYLPAVRDIATHHKVLFIAEEIHSGLGRTGATFQCDNVGVVPDLYLLGKALGGGIVPVSAVVGDADILGVLGSGEHGSTFGGNPLAAAVASAVVALLETGEYQERARVMGARLAAGLERLLDFDVVSLRSAGLCAGIDIDPALATGCQVCELLLARGVLAKDAHGSTIRLAPPMVITADDIDFVVDQLEAVLLELRA